MSMRSVLVITFALMFGGSAAVGVNRYVSEKPSASRSEETTPVVVAVADIPRGVSISPEMIRVREYPKGVAPTGTVAKVEDVLDRSVVFPMLKDEPVLDQKLAPRGAGRGMAALVPRGLRAFTIHTPSVATGVAGFVLPGNKVDVLLTIEGKRGPITTTLLQNLEILAVDQRVDVPAENKVDPNQLRSVTFQVTPDQAARLALAQNRGTIQLSLRNPKDDHPANASQARLAELEGLQDEPEPKLDPAPPAPPPAPAPKFVTIYRGRQPVEQVPLSGEPIRPVRPAQGAVVVPIDPVKFQSEGQ